MSKSKESDAKKSQKNALFVKRILFRAKKAKNKNFMPKLKAYRALPLHDPDSKLYLSSNKDAKI